jgi:hypothetical protein
VLRSLPPLFALLPTTPPLPHSRCAVAAAIIPHAVILFTTAAAFRGDGVLWIAAGGAGFSCGWVAGLLLLAGGAFSLAVDLLRVQVAARKTRRATRRTIFKRAESYVKVS